MSIRERLANWIAPETRASKGWSSKDPYVAELFGLRDSVSGQMVTPERATGVAAVHACVQLISETVASLPLFPFRRSGDDGREVNRHHPLYRVLHEQANQVQTSMEFREQFVASCLLTGNGYALKVIDSRGAVTQLIPLHPEHVQPEKLINGRVRYKVTEPGKGTIPYTQDEILHLRYRSRDGYTGLSPITIARETIGIALSQQQYEGAFYKNGAQLRGVLTHPQELSPPQAEIIRDSFNRKFMGAENAHRIAVLEEGMQFQAIAISQKDAEFVESRMLNLEDIARIFRIPPPAIGILRDATYSNITEQQRSLVMHTLRPWLVRIEQAMNACLLTPDGRRTHFVEHNADALMRGNAEERFKAYRVGREWGWLSVNEIRKRENMGGIGPEGDTYREPLNTQQVGRDADVSETV